MFKHTKKFVSTAVCALCVAVSMPAFAADPLSTPLTVASVAYTDMSSVPQFTVWLSNSIPYYANTGTSACGGTAGAVPAPSVDTVKFWMSQIQGALLSGKKVNISYEDCGSLHFITGVYLIA